MNNQITDKNIIYSLSYGGLLPFVITLGGIYFGSKSVSSFSMIAFVSYSSIILSFIGAVHWGFLLKCNSIERRGLLLSISVLPGLIGWVALISPLPTSLIILVVAFPLLFVYEKTSELKYILPDWYISMRVKLTSIVTLFIIIFLIKV